MTTTPTLDVYGADQVQAWLRGNAQSLFYIVRDTYLAYHAGKAENPNSYFLRFRDDPYNRIIALPATLENEVPVAGLKWVASFPGNLERGLDRASALIIVNDRATGYPLACLEGSLISAARTAASAVVGIQYLQVTQRRRHIGRLGVVGCGPISLACVNLLCDLGWTFGPLQLFDQRPERVQQFSAKLERRAIKATGVSLEVAVASSDVVLFATSAIAPHIDAPEWLLHRPTLIHLSLRDLSPRVIRTAQNVADDIDHCMKADTSLHLTEQQDGNRAFIQLNIADLISGRVQPDPDKPRIYSPFGMGILDLAVARAIIADPRIQPVTSVPRFFPAPYVQSA
ncbi:2,3-diaminopropionate biosynthesis protein SbnB [Pseudomonas sp. 18175]|uniref:2,3-diaminopropionate biosynthesis protein SbnB n=1 Tax=Pseudomonas sp. 18175 TaxID=3390056 RepID=UPI003D1FDFE8